jgi:hypothetical protein
MSLLDENPRSTLSANQQSLLNRRTKHMRGQSIFDDCATDEPQIFIALNDIACKHHLSPE